MTKYLLASGQSNMVGRGTGGSFDISPLVKVWNNLNDINGTGSLGTAFVTPSLAANPFVGGCNNMAVQAADDIARALNEDVRLIIVADGGQPIEEWYSGGSAKPMLTRIMLVLAASGVSRIDGFLWHQGEGDGNTPYATYESRFNAILRTIRDAGYISDTTPVVIGETSVGHAVNATLSQLDASSARIGLAHIANLPTQDGTHFTGASLVLAGAQYAAVYRALTPALISFDGIRFEAGRIEIGKNGRRVATTNGTLVNMLTTNTTISGRTLDYPDVTKDWLYQWVHSESHDPVNERWAKSNTGTSYISAVPQKFATNDVLMAMPAGADFFAGRLRLRRTLAPADIWIDETLDVLPIENQWIPFMGAVSVLLEAGQGFKRMLHVFVNGSNVLIRREQSVSVAPAGIGAFTIQNDPFAKEAGTYEVGAAAGIPVKRRATASTNRPSSASSGGADLPTGATATPLQDRRYGHSADVPVNDNSNYRSVYSIDFVLRAGRRS